MNTFLDLTRRRRSCRHFSDRPIAGEDVSAILQSALMAPTSRNQRSWHFVLVEDATDLEKLSDAKEKGVEFLREAPLGIVVVGTPMDNDCWVEDGSIAAVSMQYQAQQLGIASCWIQIRGRRLSDGTPSAEIVKGILSIPDEMEVLCMLAFGYPAKALPPHNEGELKWENVHIGSFRA